VKIEVLLVANKAEVAGALLNVEGGGWEHYNVPFFPWTLRGAVAGIVVFEGVEIGSTPELGVDMTDQAGQVEGFHASMVASAVRPMTTAGVPMRLPFAIPFSTVVRGPTTVKITLSGLAEGTAIAFSVPDPVPDAPPPPPT
jgi:hypothetical protein